MALKDRYLTVAQAAKLVGTTRQTVYRWINEGKIPVEKIGRETLIEAEEFYRHMDMAWVEIVRSKIAEKIFEILFAKYSFMQKNVAVGEVLDQTRNKSFDFIIKLNPTLTLVFEPNEALNRKRKIQIEITGITVREKGQTEPTIELDASMIGISQKKSKK